MRKITQKAVTATAVAAVGVALAAAPASALPITYDVQNGGAITGGNLGPLVAFGNVNGSTLECTSSTFTATLPSGTGLPGDNIGKLDALSFSSPGGGNGWCVVNGSVPASVTALDALPSTPGTPDWEFDAIGPAGANTTDIRLNNIKLELDAVSVPCNVTIGGAGPYGSGGYIEGTYTNPPTGTLSIPFLAPGNIKVLTATPSAGCSGLFSVGEPISLAVTYEVANGSGVGPTIT